MFFFLISGCASFQAGASKKDFQQAPFHRIYAEKLDSELLGVGDQQLRAQKIELLEEGLHFSVQSQDMCIKRDKYNELHYSEAVGVPILGQDWLLGQILGWTADVSVLGLSYVVLNKFRAHTEDKNPEIFTSIAGLGVVGINSYFLQQSSDSRFKNATTEKETLVPCGNWKQEESFLLSAKSENTPIPIEKNSISLAQLTDVWLTAPKETLNISWEIASTKYKGTQQGVYELRPQKEWLCHGLDSPQLTPYLNSLGVDALLLPQETSCPLALKQKICTAYTSRVAHSTYSVSSQEFIENGSPLSLQNIDIYKQHCDVEAVWNQIFVQESNRLIESGIGLFEISELIEQHDGILNIKGSAPMKESFISYAFSGIMDRYEAIIRLYLYPTLHRYNSSEGVSRKAQQQNNNRIRTRLEQDLEACPDIWPAQSAPCLESYLQLITNRNEERSSYLKEQFLACSDKDTNIQILCINPLKEHSARYGTRWQQSIQNSWRINVYRNAQLMLKEDTPPAKKINQSLVYLQGWEPELGANWQSDFVTKYIRPEIESMIQIQIQDQSLASFEIGAQIVENYRNVLGDRWANNMRMIIDRKENSTLNSADKKANEEARKLKNSRCSLWQYPKSAACTSRFSGFEECTPAPTINKRVYPDCTPVNIQKCLCP